MNKQATPNQVRKMVAHNVRLFREDAGVSQERLARSSSVDRKTINRIENGHFSPSLHTLCRIAISQKKDITQYFKGAK